jgi:hypothetical protein
MEEFTGEHNSAGYARPVEVLMVLEIKDTPSWVSGLGIENDDTVTAWLHIRSFKERIYPILDEPNDSRNGDYKTIYSKTPWLTNSYLKKIQPKPKDCFQILTIGCDREWDRGAKIWEITNVEDELISEKLNPAMGHYVWKITAKRYRYSFEYGMSKLDDVSKDNPLLGNMGETGNHQVYENEVVRKFLAGVQLVTEDTNEEMECEDSPANFMLEDGVFTEVIQKFDKGYSQAEVCDDAKKEVFDMERHDTEIYSHVDSGGFF